MDDELFTVQEVAQKLKITRKGVYDLMRDGRLRYVQIGLRQRRITGAALRAFIAAREHGLGESKGSSYNSSDARTPSLAAA